MHKLRRRWLWLGVLMAIVLAKGLHSKNQADWEAAQREYAARVLQKEAMLIQALSDMRQGTEPDEEALRRQLPETEEIHYWDHYTKEDGLHLVTRRGILNVRGFLLTEVPISPEDIATAEKCGVYLTEWAEGEKSYLYQVYWVWD